MNRIFLDLGLQPLANEYLKKFNPNQKKYRLKIFFNLKNKLVSISKRISSKKMFNNNYPYRSSMSQTMKYSFKDLSKEINKRFNPNKILEIGSNDGALLTNFYPKKVVGVEPCSNLAKITKKKGYTTYSEYWDLKLALKLKKEFNSFDLIYSANTLTHISNLTNVFRSICKVLSKNGVLIIEDPSLLECIKKNSYDQFYNEHIYLFSAISVNNLIKKFNLQIFDIKNLKTHGGSLRYYIKRVDNKKIKISKNVNLQIKKELKYGLDQFATYQKFSRNVMLSKKKLVKIIANLKKDEKTLIGYGATAKATTVLNFCNLDIEMIDFFVDTTPEKFNKFMPGKKIKIYKYHKRLLDKSDYIFLGAWNFKNEIFNKEKKFIKNGGKFITHVPNPKIINK
jgi:methylation protein EvaC